MADFGEYSGLAVRSNLSDQIGDYERHDIRMQQNKAMAESKAALFSDNFKYQNSANQFDHKLIDEYASNVTKEIGAYYKENPDAMYNKDKRVILDGMFRKIKDNEHTLRGFATDQNLKALHADLQEVAKNPQMYDQDAYKKLLEQEQNYSQFGNQYGLEAAQKEGLRPFIYSKPQPFVDIDEVYRKIGDSMEAKGFKNVNNGRDGAFETFARPEDLKAQAESIYATHKRQLDQQYASKGIDPVNVGMQKLNSYVKTTFNNGEKNRLVEQMALANYTHGLKVAENRAASTGKNADYYTPTVLNTNWVKLPAEKISATFGSTLPHKLPNANGAPIENTGDIFYPEGDVYDKGFRTDGKYKKTGVKVIDGYVIKPISFGVDVAGYLYDPSGRSGDPNLKGTDYEDYEIKPEFKKYVSFMDTKPDKDGKTQKVLRVKTQSEIDSTNPYYMGEFNDELLTTKQKEGLNITQTQETFVDDKGNLFDANNNYLGKAPK